MEPLIRAGTALLALLLAVAAAGATSGTAAPIRPALPGLMFGSAPWGPNDGRYLNRRLKAIGLDALPREALLLHIHQRMAILIDGRFVDVPAGIGIDANGKFITELHTHDARGIIHVESPVKRRFTLGEFFDVWGLRFSSRCLGSYCTNGKKRVWIWTDGRRVRADPRKIVLTDHLSIVVAYGTFTSIPKPIPKHFPFPKGY
jgi:hypothetical protein